jgi:hypothetical protein
MFGLNHTDQKHHGKLVSDHPCIDAFKLQREGNLLAPRVAEIWIDGERIGLALHPLVGRVFICPMCNTNAYRLYRVEAWGCRKCHGLSYASRHRGRTVPGWSRLIYLRRRIDAGPPFSPIKRKRSNAKTGSLCARSEHCPPSRPAVWDVVRPRPPLCQNADVPG